MNDAQSLAAYVADARKTAHGDSNDSEIQAWQDLGEHLETMLADGRLVFTDGSTYVPPSTDGDED